MTETGNNEVRQHVGTISVKNIAIGKARTVGRISEAPSAVCYQPPKAQDRVWIREAGPADGATLIRPTQPADFSSFGVAWAMKVSVGSADKRGIVSTLCHSGTKPCVEKFPVPIF